MSETTERFAGLARDLLHLEITLVSRPFVGRVSAPDPQSQLVELAQSYQAEIESSRMQTQAVRGQMTGLESLDVATPEEMEPLEPVDSRNLRASFDNIIDKSEEEVSNLDKMKDAPAVSAGLEMHSSSLESLGDSSVGGTVGPAGNGRSAQQLTQQEQKLKRIQENSRQIKAILDEMNGSTAGPVGGGGLESLSAEDSRSEAQMKAESIMQIRKLWEIRPDDEILMRTVISMDGDVITQINPDYAGADFTYLHTLHDQSIKVSVAFWKELIGILSDFITNLLDRISLR